jgi:tetratricopeptide (TPR) repeat protein
VHRDLPTEPPILPTAIVLAIDQVYSSPMVHPSFTDRSNPDWRESLEVFEYGREAMHEEDYPRAIELFQKSWRLEPNYKTSLLLGDCLVKKGRLNEAVLYLAAATSLNRQGIAPAHLAEAWFELGDLGRAKEMIDIALQRQSHKLLYLLANL